jgi:regulator of cell morphogenesis and NO signaling
LDKLCDYIEQRHHSYVVEKTPFLQQKLQKLCDVHGANHHELFEVKDLFDGAVDNLTAHMKKEEGILFPYVRKMEKFKKEGAENPEGFGNILGPVSVMMAEHDTEGERFRKIRMITGEYQAPADGCSTYEVTYRTLEEFENDLHRHIHIENNILFPKAIEFEAEILSLKAD